MTCDFSASFEISVLKRSGKVILQTVKQGVERGGIVSMAKSVLGSRLVVLRADSARRCSRFSVTPRLFVLVMRGRVLQEQGHGFGKWCRNTLSSVSSPFHLFLSHSSFVKRYGKADNGQSHTAFNAICVPMIRGPSFASTHCDRLHTF